MYKVMKMSKYNFFVYDHEGNLILYNFLTGLQSLTKVMKSDIEKFTNLFLTNSEIYDTSCEEYVETVDVLLKLGILVAADVDENVLCDSKHYEEVYDNKLSLVILPTGGCNFNCTYCLEVEQSFFRGAMTADSQNAILKFIQKKIHNHKALQVSWFGGEPLLTLQTIMYLSENFIKICKARFLPYSAQMTTNGFLLDADTFNMLYKLKIYTYMITIDGFKEQHDKLRFTHNGTGTYDKIMENLLRIRNNKQYKFAHIIIRVNITKTFLNILDDFINYMDSLFSDDPRFSFIFVPAGNYSNTKYSDDNIFVDNEEEVLHLHKNEVYMNKFYPENLKIHSINPEKGCPSNVKNSYVISPDLKIYKCCAHYDMSVNNIGHINSKGDLLLDETLHSRWYLVNQFIQKTSDSCKECFYLPTCYNNSKSCPVLYLRPKPEILSCPLKNDKYHETLTKSVLYAAQKFSCTSLVL